MSWQDRDYNSGAPGSGGPGSGGRFGASGGGLSAASMVTWLLGINCVVFLLDSILGGSTRGSAAAPHAWGAFSIDKAVYGLQLWRWVTYQFLHHDLFHLLFNMIVLYFFGRMMESWWGSKRFLVFYLLCGTCGAFIFTALTYVPNLLNVSTQSTLVGASGSVFGMLVGAAVLFPHQRIMLLIPPIPMTLRTMALVFLGLAAFSILVGSRNAGGEAAHLGGALLGFVLVKFPNSLNWADRLSSNAIQAGATSGRWQRKQQRRREQSHATQAEVDRILDKVKQRGLASLTEREKRTLNKATDEQRRAG